MQILERNSIGNGRRTSESGMSLVETTIALVIIMIALLGVVHAFTYTVAFNAGNAVRAEALAILQEEVETMRAAKWTSSGMVNVVAGTGPTCDPVITNRASNNGGVFEIERSVDDDPLTEGCQVDATTQLKEITVTVRPPITNRAWQFAVPITVVFRRTRGN